MIGWPEFLTGWVETTDETMPGIFIILVIGAGILLALKATKKRR